MPPCGRVCLGCCRVAAGTTGACCRWDPAALHASTPSSVSPQTAAAAAHDLPHESERGHASAARCHRKPNAGENMAWGAPVCFLIYHLILVFLKERNLFVFGKFPLSLPVFTWILPFLLLMICNVCVCVCALQVVQTFSRCVLSCEEEVDLDELLASRLLSFLMDHHQDVLQVPVYLRNAVEDHITFLRSQVTQQKPVSASGWRSGSLCVICSLINKL